VSLRLSGLHKGLCSIWLWPDCHRQVIGATLEEPRDFFEEKLGEEDSDKQGIDDGRSQEG
jgi:hypothetical protein